MRAMNPPDLQDLIVSNSSELNQEHNKSEKADGAEGAGPGAGPVSPKKRSSLKTNPDTQEGTNRSNNLRNSVKEMSTTRRKNSALYTKTPTPFFKGPSTPNEPSPQPKAGLEEVTKSDANGRKGSTMNATIDAKATGPTSTPGPAPPLSPSESKHIADTANSIALFNNGVEKESALSDARKSATSSKLSVFIICRFEKLTTEDQNILRSAR